MSPGPVSDATRASDATYPPMNSAPAGFDPARDLPPRLFDLLSSLHREFTPRQQQLVARRQEVLVAAHRGRLPDYLPPSPATTGGWRVELPDWCRDQRNQMTGPADDGELCVKMLNSGAPGVMLDLEDSIVNAWPHLLEGVKHSLASLYGELGYYDTKRQRQVAIQPR